jgi:hypothetical protein
MVLALATGIFYFTWAVTGVSLSFGLSVLIIGIPFVVLFLGSVRALSLLEGRIVEVMLGVRMPRRPPYPALQGLSLMKRIGAMFTDGRTWGTLFYTLLMLPLGIIYFSLTVTLVSISVAFASAPLAMAFDNFELGRLFVDNRVTVDWGFGSHVPGWGEAFLLCAIGVVLLFATLHLVRGIGHMHGQIAKHLLVRGS